MKKITYILLSVALPMALISCDSTNPDDATPAGDSTAVATGTELPPAVINTGQAPATTNIQAPNVVTTSPAQGVTATLKTTAAGMNPPHGQPGHRCDIAEGAPLNSPPGNTAKPGAPGLTQPNPVNAQTITAPVVTPQTTTPTTVTAPGMNPAHGQPGHDCAIAVGAPLKK